MNFFSINLSIKLLLIAVITILNLGGCGNDSSNEEETGLFGAVTPSDEEIASYPKTLPPGALARALDLSEGTDFSRNFVDNTLISSVSSFIIPKSSLPIVRAQGTEDDPGFPGSCEVWSAGYAMGSFTANKVNKKNIQDASNNVSTAFVFMRIFNSDDKKCAPGAGGTSANQTLEYLVHNDAPSLNTVRYEPNCDYLNSLDTDRKFETDLRIGSWTNYKPSETTLEDIKGYIAQNQIVQISIIVPYLFGQYNSGVFTGDDKCPQDPITTCINKDEINIACRPDKSTKSGCIQHGVAIVGFDDVRQALKIMNSFGADWGEQGFMWLSYETFEKIFLNAYLAHPVAGNSTNSIKTSGKSEADIINSFQWIENENGIPKDIYLIFETSFDTPLLLSEITITTAEGEKITHTYGHSFSNGYHYIIRHDGLQFEPGDYILEMNGETALGEKVEFILETTVEKADGNLPSAQLPDTVTGTNGQVAVFVE